MAQVTLNEIKQGEAKTYTVTVKRDGSVIDVSSATFTTTVKKKKSDGTALITIADGSFDKTDEANGIVKFTLTDTHTTTGIGLLEVELQNFLMEIKVVLTAGTDIDQSDDLILPVRRAVLPT